MAEVRDLTPVRDSRGTYLEVNGERWSGAPGFAYQPLPGDTGIEDFEKGNLADIYKALLPVGGRGIDAICTDRPDVWSASREPEY